MAEAFSHVNILKNLETNLRLVVDQIRDGESDREKASFTGDTYWNYLGVLFKTLSLEATKFSLAYMEAPFPTAEQCEAMVASMEKSALALVSAFYSLPKSQGLNLRKRLKSAVLDVLQNILGLVSTLAQVNPEASDRKQATGQIWEVADNFASLPKNNCEACQLTLKQAADLVKDALDEVEEMVNNDGQCQDLDEILADEGTPRSNVDTWSQEDKELVGPCRGLVKTARSLLKKTREAAQNQGKCETADQVAQLDDLSELAERLSPAVDNLVSSLYPPVDCVIVGNTATALSSTIESMLTVLRNSHLTGDQDIQWLDFLVKALNHNSTKVKDLLSKS